MTWHKMPTDTFGWQLKHPECTKVIEIRYPRQPSLYHGTNATETVVIAFTKIKMAISGWGMKREISFG